MKSSGQLTNPGSMFLANFTDVDKARSSAIAPALRAAPVGKASGRLAPALAPKLTCSGRPAQRHAPRVCTGR